MCPCACLLILLKCENGRMVRVSKFFMTQLYGVAFVHVRVLVCVSVRRCVT